MTEDTATEDTAGRAGPPAVAVAEAGAPARFRELYATLRDRICLLDYRPGSRLREEALATEFGVSRTPLRRVLGHLEARGLVRSVQGVGTLVTELEPEALAHAYELRRELAVLIGRLSPVADPAPVAASIEALAERSRVFSVRSDHRAFARLNMDFFRQMMRLSQNAALREASETLYYRTTRVWLYSIPRMDLSEEIAIFRQELEQVAYALRLGDIEAACHIHRVHVTLSFERVRRRVS